MATQAMAVVESWQSAAFETPEYAKGPTYHALLKIFLAAERESELCLRGNQPELRAHRLGDGDVIVLSRAQQVRGRARLLDLSYNALSDVATEYLADWLKDPGCCLETLILGYNDFGPEGAAILANALQFNSSVSTLVLDGCKIGRAGGLQVAAMLQVNRSISRLGLAHTDMDTDCIIAMATVLIGNRTLRSVDLAAPLLHSRLEETTVHLSRMLERNSTLQELSLAKHSITDTGAGWLSRHLRVNSALTHLNLSCNSLSRDGGRLVAEFLSSDPPLTTLLLSANHIEDDGMIEISKALKSNHLLARLDVCSNSIGDRGLCRLAEALQQNSSLTHVAIWGNDLGEPTCNAFRSLLESSRLHPDHVDVRPYEVDGVTYLARTEQTL